MLINPNDINSKFYNQIYSHIKGKEVTDQECLLIIGLINHEQGRILDIGAGTGRHAVELANRGYQVTALDSSSGMLAEIPQTSNLNVIHQDVFRFELSKDADNQPFDIIILMWNTFNEIALSLDRAQLLLAKLKTLIKPNTGKILINTENVKTLPFVPEFTFDKEIDGHNYRVEWKNLINNKLTNITKSLEQITIDDNSDHKAYITQRWYLPEQIQKIAANVQLKMSVQIIKANDELYLVLN